MGGRNWIASFCVEAPKELAFGHTWKPCAFEGVMGQATLQAPNMVVGGIEVADIGDRAEFGRPVVLAGLTAWLLGLALSEGSGLAVAGADRFVGLAAEALGISLQVAVATLEGLAAGTRDGFYTAILGPV
jgi:hypothetical protein